MGSSASKAAKSAASQSGRKLPSQVSSSFRAAGGASSQPQPTSSTPGPPGPEQYVGPTVHPPPKASASKSDDIARDGSDPAYLSHLQSLGTVAPNPFLPLTQQSPSNMHPTKSQAATSKPAPPNSAAVMLAARRRFQQASAREEEAVGQPDFAGREFLDVMTLQKVLALHQEGVPGGEIERQLKLKKGVAGRLTNGHFAALKAGN